MTIVKPSLGELSEANYIASRYCGLWTVDCGLKKLPTTDSELPTKQNYQLKKLNTLDILIFVGLGFMGAAAALLYLTKRIKKR